jgi:hypothetical protein
MTNKKIILIAIAVVMVHFIITAVIGHYISVQIGTQIGQAVISGFTAVSDKNNKEDATTIYQNMKRQSDEIKAKWQIPKVIIALPVKPAIDYLLEDIRQNQMKRYIAKEITKDEFRTRGLITDYAATFLNSLSLGLLVYIVLRILNQYKRER